MKLSDFIIGLVTGLLAFVLLCAKLGVLWSALVAFFAGGSAMLLSNAFRMTQAR